MSTGYIKSSSYHKRRLIRAYRQERNCFKIKLLTGNQVLFDFNGEEIDFTYQDGRLTRGQLRSYFLTTDDWAFLFTLAEELMGACIEGYKASNRKRSKKRAIRQQLHSLEMLNPRQRRLF